MSGDWVTAVPGEPIGATQQWRKAVTEAAMRCSCAGQCSVKHSRDRFNDEPGRCVNAMDRRRDFTVKVPRLLLHRLTLEPWAPLVAVCQPCWDGLERIVKRSRRQRLLKSQTETLLDYLNGG